MTTYFVTFQVTEKTTETMVKSPDGLLSREFQYQKETSESTGEIGGDSNKSSVFSILAKIFFFLIIAAVGFYLFTVSWTSEAV